MIMLCFYNFSFVNALQLRYFTKIIFARGVAKMRYRLALIRKILLNNELIRCNSLFWFILNKMSAASQRAVLRKTIFLGLIKNGE